jgi:CCR4-NOT transcription complex subunit 2
MIGSSYPTSGGSLSQNQMQGGNNSLGSMGMLHDHGDNAPFDINDFPQLTGRPSSAGGPQGQYGKAKCWKTVNIFPKFWRMLCQPL